MIEENQSFENCGGEILCELIGGSKLYGLDNEDSDTDYRGLFKFTDKTYLAGFNNVESIVLSNSVDATYYELAHFLRLLRKSNTQVMEILFAPDSHILKSSGVFDCIRENKYNFIDSERLKSSLLGYIYSEIKLATGERTGRLGGKRREKLDKHGFSPKNFVQLIRLCEVGIEFFRSGEYQVNIKNYNEELHKSLMLIKNHPEMFNKEELLGIVHKKIDKLEDVMKNSKIKYEFDLDLASDVINNVRYA